MACARRVAIRRCNYWRPVERTLHVDAPGALLLRNRSGLYVIRRSNALSAHEAQFLAPPVVPAPGSQTLGINVSDPAGGYLPVTTRIRLPRTGDLAQATDPASLFQPAVVPLSLCKCSGWSQLGSAARESFRNRQRRRFWRCAVARAVQRQRTRAGSLRLARRSIGPGGGRPRDHILRGRQRRGDLGNQRNPAGGIRPCVGHQDPVHSGTRRPRAENASNSRSKCAGQRFQCAAQRPIGLEYCCSAQPVGLTDA